MTTTATIPKVTSESTALRRRRKPRFRPFGLLRIVILLGFALFCVIPLIWLLLAPTKTDEQLLFGNPLSFGSFQRLAESWTHLAQFNGGVIFQWMANSLFYSIAGLIITLVTSLLAGYALATMSFPGRKLVLTATLFAMVLPASAVVLPLFLEINAVHLTNTAWSVILPASFYPFGVYLAFVYFTTSVPPALLEAAAIDGCSPFQTFMRVVMPLARPLVGLLAFFSFVANWNNYFLPYVMLSSQSAYNLPVGLGILLTSTPALHPEEGGSFVPITRPEAALAGLIVVVPIALLFLFFQRFLVRGILAGSVKS